MTHGKRDTTQKSATGFLGDARHPRRWDASRRDAAEMSEHSAEHTPEPWHADDYTVFANWTGRGGDVVADCGDSEHEADEQDANARRIVATVNACAGIPTASLEQGVVAKLVKALELGEQAWSQALANQYGQPREQVREPVLNAMRAALSLASSQP